MALSLLNKNEYSYRFHLSCTFEDYEKTVADFHEKVGHTYVKDYEISKESDHKGHLVLNVINPQAFMGAAGMYFKDWDAANGADYSIYSLTAIG